VQRQPTGVPGSEWRVLAHEEAGTFEAENRGRFDELVVDRWLHIENMDTHVWWMRVGDAQIMVELDADGRPRVDVVRGAYAEVNGTTTEHVRPEPE
jgi:hypothetical protein